MMADCGLTICWARPLESDIRLTIDQFIAPVPFARNGQFTEQP